MRADEPGAGLLEHASDAFVVVDETGEVTAVYGSSEEVLGNTAAALVGTDVFEYVHPADVEDATAVFERAVNAEGPADETATYRFRTASDEWAWLETRVADCTEEAVGGYVLSSRSVTDRVAAERERDELNDRLEAITGTIGDVVWLFSGDWSELLFVNDAYEEVFGQSVATLQQDPTSFLEAIHPEDVPRTEAAMERVSEGEPDEIDIRVDPTRDYGTYVHVEGEPIVRDGSVERIVGFTRDVTDQRRRERQLAVMDNLLRHNIRNDLSIVIGHAGAIEREADESIAQRAALIQEQSEELVESAEKQREIIDLLTRPARCTSIDVTEAVADAADVVSDRYPDATVEQELPDRAQARVLYEIQQALVELAENAIRHANADAPTVTMTVESADDEVVVEVRDSCPPIPEEEYCVLTGDQEMDDIYHSTGLGLWLVYWVVDLSGGNIEFERAGDGGNVVRLSFPRK